MALKDTLTAHRITPSQLGLALKQRDGRFQGQAYSRSAMAQLLNHGVLPKSTPETDLKRQIEDFLTRQGVSPAELATLWPTAATASTEETTKEHEAMLPTKEELTQTARRHFNLLRDPFGDVEDDSQMYLSPQVLDARESLLDIMKHGGFMALVGESGAGKSTLLEDCEEHIRAHALPVTLIKPPITGMDTDKDKGSPLRARSILLMILDAVAPHSRRYQELPRLTAEVIRQLSERKSDQSFCLVIDDAHRLGGHTLNHLKDFYEFKMGRKRLLGIVLMGQPKLGQRLDPHNPDVVQITQRCKVEVLPPLLDATSIKAYLDTRLKLVGMAGDSIFADDAYEAIRTKLAGVVQGAARKAVTIEQAYPLAINNTVIRAMNLTAKIMDDKVGAHAIKGG